MTISCLMLMVSCGGSGGSTQSSTGGASGYFSQSVATYTTNGHHIIKLRIADINFDGRNDVIALTQWEYPGQELQISYQGSTGQLDRLETIPVSSLNNVYSITGIGIGDVNGDGYPEILLAANLSVVQSGPTSALLVLRYDTASNSTKEVQRLPLFDPIISSSGGGDFVVFDVNGDGRKDVVGIVGRHVGAFLQNTSGALDPAVVSSVGVINDVFQINRMFIAGDINADGLQDIVYRTDSLSLTVVTQQPSLGLNSAQTFQITTQYWPTFDAFAVGDVSGDGRNDIVAVDPASGNPYFNIFTQDLLGGFSKSLSFIPNGSSPCSLGIVDLDGDGVNEMVGNYTTADPAMFVAVYKREANGNYSAYTYSTPTSSFGACQSNQTLAIGDVSGDGKPDVVTTWGTDGLFVFKNAK